jgi:hypothetical protein
MRRARRVFLAASTVALLCFSADALAVAPRVVVHAGDFVRLSSTSVVCRIPAAGDQIECFRVTRNGSDFTPGGYSLSLQNDGRLSVSRRVGHAWTYVYGRVPAAVSRVYLARPGDRFRVGGGRLGCNVGATGHPSQSFVQCGLLDASGNLGSPGSVGFEFHATGSFGVVQFDNSGTPTTTFDSKAADRGGGFLKLSISAIVSVDAGVGAGITCAGGLSQGLKVLTCGLYANGAAKRYTFALREDGLLAIFDLSSGTPTDVFDVPGTGRPAAGRTEAPTGGNVFVAHPGEVFKLAGSALTCEVRVVKGKVVVRCGFSDDKGIGAPIATGVEVRADGSVAALHFDARRRAHNLYTTPAP